MAIKTVTLSTLLNRMNRWVAIDTTEEQYKVRDLDEALRSVTREILFPWMLRETNLRVFSGIDLYPVSPDHLGIAYIDGKEDSYGGKPRPYYTSLIEFFQDPISNRSMVAEIWDGAERFLGVKNKLLSNLTQTVDGVTNDDNYTVSGDITAYAINYVVYKDSNSSIKLTLVDSTNTGTVVHTFADFTDAEYQRKYYFRYIYLASIPTSITLSIGEDASNKLTKTMTTQFTGQDFKVNDWNLVGFDLNDATQVGTASTTFGYEDMTLTGADTGSYYLGPSTMRPYTDMVYWYYSEYNIIAEESTIPDKAYFFDDAATPQYNTSDKLVCDVRFADCVMYDAMLLSLSNVENAKIYTVNAEADQPISGLSHT